MELIRIPKAAENVTESTVVRWLVSPGEFVRAGSPIVEMVNSKAEFEMWPETSGVLKGVYAAENSTVPVGFIIATVGGKDEALPDVESQNAAILAKSREEAAAMPASAALSPRPDARAPGSASRVRATPAARRAAREKGVDLAEVRRTIAEDRAITAEDVENFVKRRPEDAR